MEFLFISVVIIALTQMVKLALPQHVHGWFTILVAFVVGIAAALFSEILGLEAITIADGIIGALGAIGITTTASKAGGGAAGDEAI